MKKILLGSCCALLFTLFYWFSASGMITGLLGSDLLHKADLQLQDIMLQKPKNPHPDIYVIGIDEETLRELGPWNTWTRGMMAELLEILNADPDNAPAVIGVDVSYFSTTQPEYDNALVKAAARNGNVVVACEAVLSDAVRYDAAGNPYTQKMAVEGLDYPFEALRAVTRQGIVNSLPDADGVIRNALFCAESGQEKSNNFSYEVYRMYAEKKGILSDTMPPLDQYNRFPIAYTAKAGDYNNGISFIRVLRGEIPPAAFADAIVLIGPYATGMMDQYYTPLDTGELMYGVEIHGNLVQMYLEENYKQPLSIAVQAVCLFGMLLLLYLLFLRFDPRISTAAILVTVLFSVSVGILLYQAGYVINLLYLPCFAFLLYLYRMIYAYFSERMNRQMVTETFKRYMAPSIVEHLLKDPKARGSMDGQKKDIAVLFADIRGFTTMSEEADTAEVVAILNECLSAAAGCIFQNEGTLDKFIGDAAMAIFGAPLDLEDYTYKAVKTAVELSARMEEIGARYLDKYGKTVRFGFGVHCGEAIVGNIGATFRMDYTAIGDVVNTAARLESQAAAGQILVSAAVYERLQKRISAECLGPMTLKGKQHEIVVYQVNGLTKMSDSVEKNI